MKPLILILILFMYANITFADARYFAEVNNSNVVKRVIVADNIEWCKQALGGTWIETFIDAPDKNYAGKGHDYFEIYKDFVAPAPFASWELDSRRRWQAPIPMPEDGKLYHWNETLLKWGNLNPF